MGGQSTVFFSTLAQAEQELPMTLGALFHTTTKVMKPTCTDQALRAFVGQQTKLCFVSEGNLSFNSLHTRICFCLLLLTKITDCHPGDSLPVAETKICLLKFMPLSSVYQPLQNQSNAIRPQKRFSCSRVMHTV